MVFGSSSFPPKPSPDLEPRALSSNFTSQMELSRHSSQNSRSVDLSSSTTIPSLQWFWRLFFHYAWTCCRQVFTYSCFTVTKESVIQKVVVGCITKTFCCQNTSKWKYIVIISSCKPNSHLIPLRHFNKSQTLLYSSSKGGEKLEFLEKFQRGESWESPKIYG